MCTRLLFSAMKIGQFPTSATFAPPSPKKEKDVCTWVSIVYLFFCFCVQLYIAEEAEGVTDQTDNFLLLIGKKGTPSNVTVVSKRTERSERSEKYNKGASSSTASNYGNSNQQYPYGKYLLIFFGPRK